MPTVKTTKIRNYTSQGSQAEYVPDHKFDRGRMRHYLDGEVNVLHCHHYATLFTQLAIDAQNLDGPKLMVEAAKETFLPMLKSYFKKHMIEDISDRIAIAEQHYSFIGLGKMKMECTELGAKIMLLHSHVDEGWLKKWGQRKNRINFISEGYIKAACAAIFVLDSTKAIKITETHSIVCGAAQSKFTVDW